MKRALLTYALLPVVAGTACDRSEPGKVARDIDLPRVEAVRPEIRQSTSSFPAIVESVERAELALRSGGRILEVRVDAGSRVSRGDVLLVVDAKDVAARVRQAKAERDRAERAFRRLEALQRDGAATDQELDDARARLAMAVASVEEAEAQLSHTALRAPFTGSVTSRLVDPGDFATPGRPVLALARVGDLQVVADLPASRGRRVGVGDTLTVFHPGSSFRLPALVARVAPAVEAGSQTFRVEAALPPLPDSLADARGALVPGTYVRLQLADAVGESLWVPEPSVIRRGQLTGVFVIREGTAELNWIRTGERESGAVEVLAGVSPTDVLVYDPPPGLEDGQPVHVRSPTEFQPARGAPRGTR